MDITSNASFCHFYYDLVTLVDFSSYQAYQIEMTTRSVIFSVMEE